MIDRAVRRAGGAEAGAKSVRGTSSDALPEGSSTRDIAWAAVRARLSQVAFEVFLREGFDHVTVNAVSAAAGVSRSTFLRYFSSKEDAVLCAFDAEDEQAAAALRACPPEQDDWTALRHAVTALLEPFRRSQQDFLPLARLVETTPALSAGRREKQIPWRDTLARALSERAGGASFATPPLSALVRASAAVECMNIAVARWATSDGREDLDELLDASFAALRVP
ncbi:TetR family transcriptional regulator [Streptomyces flaveolus]|uniref:TetR family transcriptional regulator n=1 Tax=Streptomyces flaveolus TaxID=67297 RepID=UPI0036FFAF56